MSAAAETLIEGIMAIQRIIDEEGLPPAANAGRCKWRSNQVTTRPPNQLRCR